MQYYHNPLHPQIPSAQSTLHRNFDIAMSSPQIVTNFLRETRLRVPQTVYTPRSKWIGAMGYSAPLHLPITYDHVGFNGQGVAMGQLSARSVHGELVKANDLVLAYAGRRKIILRILWPGYEHVEWARSIDIYTENGHITRAELGAKVSNLFLNFFAKARSEICTSSSWRIASDGIRCEHLFLVSLHNVFEDVWQANVAIDMR